jgi:cbb3-type cytochrome oxidase maturation protein
MDITVCLFFVAYLMGIAAWCIFLWAIRTGQFRDVEEIKYQIVPKTDTTDTNAPTTI